MGMLADQLKNGGKGVALMESLNGVRISDKPIRNLTDKVEPRTLPGFMELLPKEQIQFNKMYDTIRKTYERFGFIPLDTPILESAEVLLAKAGGESDKQIYRFTKGDTDLAMRFDLTVPLAKYVAKNYNNLAFPFRRYQIGKVFRGEKAQKGRYREFYQCDIDIIGDGKLSLINDAEIPSIIYNTFKALGFDAFQIKFNNRKMLNGLFESLSVREQASEVLRIIDKIDKVGKENAAKELESLGIQTNHINKLFEFLGIKGDNLQIINQLMSLHIDNDTFALGLQDISQVNELIKMFGVPDNNYTIDLTIARGLDYYTGTVYETTLNDYPSIGSVCSGGRYDNLAEYYTDRKLPGVGISIGLTRLFYQFEQVGIVKPVNSTPSSLLIVPIVDDLSYPLELASKLRNSGINTEIYLEQKSLKAKLNYANRLGVPYVGIIGETESDERTVTIKNMESGEQNKVSFDDVLDIIASKIR
jgi:histidyl-tRNA synthetase